MKVVEEKLAEAVPWLNSTEISKTGFDCDAEYSLRG